ncbi:MAG: hypothetical protein Q8P74_00685 [bacterium]|nr:hypothetical protein [bacterium]
MKKFIFISIISFIIFPLGAEGAILYLEPAGGNYYQGDTFIVETRIDTEGECINAIEGNLSFSQDTLEIVDFSKGNSILTIWLKEPAFDQNSGKVFFAGGIPGGYCGTLSGDSGRSNLLSKIVFKVKENSRGRQARVDLLDSSQALLNDGLGTAAKLEFQGANFSILSGVPESPKKEWEEAIEKDKIPPEAFEMEARQDPSVFEGKYFLIFSTTDKQTGVDYYEVREGKRDWRRAESPYLLEDQSLTSIIRVRAVDKAGNVIIAEHPALEKPFPYWVVALIILIILGYWLYKRTKNKWREKEHRQS